MKTAIIIILSVILCLGFFSNQVFTGALAQQKEEGAAKNPKTIETMREEMLRTWGGDGLKKQAEISKGAEKLLAKPIDEQAVGDLQVVASESNKIANLIGYIEEGYQDYKREKYQYEFIQKAVNKYYYPLANLPNKFKQYRNQAYFNLGIKSKKAGNTVLAFFYFRDAFRLSPFAGGEKPLYEGLRYKAELEMKTILGIDSGEIKSYKYWSLDRE